MRKLVAAALVAVSVISSAWAGPAEDAEKVLQAWAAAFEARDIEAMSAVFAPDALFWGTSSKTLSTTPEGVRDYFQRSFAATESPKITVSEKNAMVLNDSLVTFATVDAVNGTREGKPYSSPGRTTWLVAKRAGGWKIIQFHRSSIPR